MRVLEKSSGQARTIDNAGMYISKSLCSCLEVDFV